MTEERGAHPISAALSIAASQAREVTRQPVYGVSLLIGAGIVALSPALAVFSLGRAEALVLDLGASAMLFFGVFIAATVVASGAAERLQDGTATLVLTRPVGPMAWLVGGFLGAAAALLQTGLLLGTALLLAARNGPDRLHAGVVYPAGAALALAVAWGVRASLCGRAFQPAALNAASLLLPLAYLGGLGLGDHGETGHFDALDPVAPAAALLATLASLTFAALGICLATRLAPAGAAALTLVAFVLGSLGVPGLPALQLFWVADAAYTETFVPLDYALGVAGYAGLYCVGALALGAWSLGGREL